MKAVPTNRYLAYFSIVVCALLADLATKSLMFSWLGMPSVGRIHWVWQDWAGFQTSLNRGALFGLGQGYSWVFALLSVAAVLAILFWLYVARAAHDWMMTIVLAAITAGILGNLYDRLGLHGLTRQLPPGVGEREYAVRDWILIQANEAWRWPNFNIADSLLVCGAAALLWHAYAYGDTPRGETATEAPSGQAGP